jgi:hypothetical protein
MVICEAVRYFFCWVYAYLKIEEVMGSASNDIITVKTLGTGIEVKLTRISVGVAEIYEKEELFIRDLSASILKFYLSLTSSVAVFL